MIDLDVKLLGIQVRKPLFWNWIARNERNKKLVVSECSSPTKILTCQFLHVKLLNQCENSSLQMKSELDQSLASTFQTFKHFRCLHYFIFTRKIKAMGNSCAVYISEVSVFQ